MVFDVAIAGAGPAGAAAAIAAAHAGARVLLLDRYDFPRDKACGDGIAPHAIDVVRELGITGVLDGYPEINVLHLESPNGTQAKRPMRRPAHVIPRTVFDARLVSAAIEAGAEFRRHVVRQIRRDGDHVEVDGIRARTLIGADGANSVVRKFLGVKQNPPGHIAIAIRGYAAQPADAELTQRLVLAKRHWPAYAWSFPIGDGRRNVGYGELIQGEPTSRAHLLDRLTTLLPGLGEIDGLRAHLLPLSTWRPRPGRGRILLAGDALSLINPFTGEGIYYALVSGAFAGEAAAMAGPLAAHYYSRRLRAQLARHLRHTTLTAKLAAAPWIADAGIRAAADDQAVFDTFVELGLGNGLLSGRLLAGVTRRAMGVPFGTWSTPKAS